ncbi:MAG: rhodanese-related sulfurtransferase [Spirulina sp. SIO3F2]|nr:rhodanese-related sulfurtransferase [Spirulina sp. SIO3F2]
MNYVVATFYKFVALPDCAQKQAELLEQSQYWSVRGTVLLATEGINGTIAGRPEAIEQVLTDLHSDRRFADLTVKTSTAADWPFRELKIKIKPEIVTFGQPDISPSDQVGTYVAPQDWNELIQDPEVTVVDTRNTYEVAIGTFQGAQNPQTDSFRDFPDYVHGHLDPQTHRKVAMFCTGGIRCEKATAYLLQQGFEAVYHLQGGILKYLEDVPTEDSLWQGECFVFDDRVALRSGLELGSHHLCSNCGYPIAHDATVCPDCHAPQSTHCAQ